MIFRILISTGSGFFGKSENIDLSCGIVYDRKDYAFGRIVGVSVPVHCRRNQSASGKEKRKEGSR